jgi:arylsulfatase
MPAQASGGVGGRNVDIVANVTYKKGDEGVLYASGTQNSGISVFIQNGRLLLDYNAFGDHTIIESAGLVPEGDHELRAVLRRGDGMSGYLEVTIDGVSGGSAEVSLYMRMISSVGPSVGFDHGSPISTRYSAPYAYTGELHEIIIEAGPRRVDTAAAEAQAEMNRQ